MKKHSPPLSHLPAHLPALGLGMFLSKPEGIFWWESRNPVAIYHSLSVVSQIEKFAWEEELYSLAEMLESASVGCRSCCGRKPGLTRSLNPFVPVHRVYLQWL